MSRKSDIKRAEDMVRIFTVMNKGAEVGMTVREIHKKLIEGGTDLSIGRVRDICEEMTYERVNWARAKKGRPKLYQLKKFNTTQLEFQYG